MSAAAAGGYLGPAARVDGGAVASMRAASARLMASEGLPRLRRLAMRAGGRREAGLEAGPEAEAAVAASMRG